ncbi:hypothetical protein Save01_06562 [Streptomyces avermitilis]|uniref:HTH luxR-type domain-containing protein n=1 Tax=Streptomyces avermitilis (strain ATCC 31267 / DSM 46492 / JCM 5070 / NBRC 14893 / NCIMB 12804 / NRRL 8165 / MA-4680) TaxID=227882 RepID=Q825M2_STRAW|nr:hypothetical protein SAVERM_7435 [Streptomyces avermitilis MA-4680 = NBRC 14893]
MHPPPTGAPVGGATGRQARQTGGRQAAGSFRAARAARETGLTTDGVTCHLRRLSERWSAANRTELVARAYALGVLSSGVWPPEAVTD